MILKPATLMALICLLTACAAPRTFRKLESAEKAALKTAAKQIDKSIPEARVLVLTDSGQMVVRLYNNTPLHRANFLDKVKSGFYDSLLFHRVINNFMIQGGDPESKYPEPGKRLGGGAAPGDLIPAEFRTEAGIYHKRGALAAAHNSNPLKSSSNCQFYIVQRPKWRPTELDSLAAQRGLTLNKAQKTLYTSMGGTPHLDGIHTVFGEVESGIEVADKIAKAPKMAGDRPTNDIRFRMFVVYLPKALRK